MIVDLNIHIYLIQLHWELTTDSGCFGQFPCLDPIQLIQDNHVSSLESAAEVKPMPVLLYTKKASGGTRNVIILIVFS